MRSTLAQEATPGVSPVTPQEAQTIARDAFIYGFPLVENYKTMYAYAIAEGNPNYKAPFNQISSIARVATPADTTVITPNSDTPYSFIVLDLRAEPVVLTVPPIREGRYFSWQNLDLYTYLAPYIGSRTTGNGGGRFLFAGPNWTGETPEGVSMVLQLPTELGFTLGRTQLFGPDDLDNVKAIQAGYTAQTLSQYLGESAPPAAPTVDWLPYDETKADGIGFFDYLSFLLQFAPTLPEDKGIRANMARIGVVPGQAFDATALTPEVQDALQAGIDAASAAIATDIATLGSASVLFGSREYLRGRYFDRCVGAKYGIYGNALEEAIYIPYSTDVAGQPLDGSRTGYTVHFAAGELPPVSAFWSLTVYDARTQLLVANPIDRYLINSPMLPELTRDAGGGLTLYLQQDRPAADREANWLPVPAGPFYCMLRLYWPQAAVLSGVWQAPAMTPDK
ncbi:MAG: DUF1254 domain-containing protein [Chloroflexota bacterium]|nr:DUF1254 domain-containing protein [Chloroflexota bacterium]